MAGLQGRRALVTGGRSGMGRGIADRLAADGARVACVQRSGPGGDEPADRYVLSYDISQPDQCAEAVTAAVEVLVGLDLLVNNAGMAVEQPVGETEATAWDRLMAANLRAPFLLFGSALPAFRSAGGGSVVNVGSIEAFSLNPGHGLYAASKAGLHAFTRAVAVDHGAEGVRCNAVASGWIDTGLNVSLIETQADSDAFRAGLTHIHPVGRTGKPADVRPGRLARLRRRLFRHGPSLHDRRRTYGTTAKPVARRPLANGGHAVTSRDRP